MNATLSLTLIVKNEETHLHNVLRNAALYADEIIIIDTGSTDRTKEIAKQYTEHVYTFPWCDDFSAARNFGIRKCTKDFIIWLDADDVILDADAVKIKELLTQQNLVDVYFLPYHIPVDQYKDRTTILYKERIFRNSKNIFFAHPVHEFLDTTDDINSFRVASIAIPVYHRNLVSINDSHERNLAIALQAVKKKEYVDDMRLWWALENAYRGVGQNELSLKTCYTAIKKKDHNMLPQQKSNLYLDLGIMLFEKKEFLEAEKYLKMATEIFPFWREPFFIYGTLQFHLKNYSRALDVFLQCKKITLPENADSFNNNELYLGKTLDRWLGKTYFRLGKINSAISHFLESF